MVTGNLAHKIQIQDIQIEKDYTFLPDKPKHTTVSLSEIINNKLRFEASAFSLDAKIAIDKVKNSKYGYVYLWSTNGFIENSFYGGRAKRNYVPKNTKGAVGFIGSAEMLEVNPKPIKFLTSLNMDIEPFKVKKNTILISRSGTIGNVSLVSETLSKLLISEHSIRIEVKEFAGYVYAFLKTEIGKTIVKSNTFGAVVDQIEPQHLEKVIIPNPPKEIKERIDELIISSYNLRDQSNEMIEKAEKILYEELQLPPIEELEVDYFVNSDEVRNFQTKLSDLEFRLDGSYHLPIVKAIENKILKASKEVRTFGDKSISKNIILPGRFKRVYVGKENGVPFFGGKQLLELNPSNIKYLSASHHSNRISEQLFLKENMIAVTCSGTIGKVNIIPKHWENWTLNQHVMRIVAKDKSLAGYIYCWLNSDYGYNLIVRNVYGSVVDEIDNRHMATVKIPILKNEKKQSEINDLVLGANELRYEAHRKEQEAIRIVNEDVINETGHRLDIAAEPREKYKKQ